MNKACIVLPHNAGLFSLINNVITCMGIYNHVHVDWSNSPIYKGEPGENVWNSLFRPTKYPVGPFDIVTNYPDQWLTFKNVGAIYNHGPWRWDCHFRWLQLGVNREIQKKAARWLSRKPRMVSVLVRSDTHAGEQVTDRNATLEEYASTIERIAGPRANIHLVAGDLETIKWFESRFNVFYYGPTRRSESRAVDFHLSTPQTVKDAENCLIEVMIMAAATTLVHQVSNMATGALYIDPRLPNYYLP